MAKQYYVKKNPAVNGSDIDWVAISGKEFYELVTSPKGKGRYFIDMDDFMIEASKEQYVEWRSEKDHSDYLREQGSGIQVLSLSGGTAEKGEIYEDSIADTSEDVEESVMKLAEAEALHSALKMLNDDEYRLMYALFFEEKFNSEHELAKQFGLSQSGISRRKKKFLRKLKISLIDFEKSSQ